MSASPSDLETGYLLACLAHGLDSTRPWPHPPQGLDWKRLAELIAANRLTGYIHALGKSQSESWPEHFREQLRIERYRWMVHGEQSRTRVHDALTALKSAGIEVIVLKGWAYITTLYGGDASQRLCEDVDLLVRPRDVDAAEAVLRLLGCELHLVSWPGYDHRYHNGERFFFTKYPALKRDLFSVGLHWGLFHTPAYDPGQVDVNALFTRARPLDVAGVPGLELSIEDSVVYACAHLGLHHRFDAALFRYFEIASLIQTALALDWDAAARCASNWRVILPVQTVLEQIESYWPGTVPLVEAEALRRLVPARRERNVHAWLQWTRGRRSFDHLLLWLNFPDWKQRPLIFLQDVFPGPDYLRRRYGPAPLGFWPFLYVRRLARALGFLFRKGDE